MRQAARVTIGIGEAFADRKSDVFWQSLADYPEQVEEFKALERAARAHAEDVRAAGGE